MMLFAADLGGYSIIQIAITIVILAAVVACVLVALKHFGIAVPGFVYHLFWIIAVAFCVILAIRFLASM